MRQSEEWLADKLASGALKLARPAAERKPMGPLPVAISTTGPTPQVVVDQPGPGGRNQDVVARGRPAAPPGPSQIERRFLQQIQTAGLPAPITEFYHLAGRDFRLDFAWPDRRIGVEIQGAAHRIKGKFAADIEKRALGLLAGWRVLEIDGRRVRNEVGIGWLRELMR